MENTMTFSELFSDLISLSGYKTTRRVAEVLREKGIDWIDFRRVSTYKNGDRVPTFRKASTILKALDYEIQDSELDDLLEYSKKASKERNMDLADVRSKAVFQNVRIDYDSLVEDLDGDEAKFLTRKRVKELFGDEHELSRYVNALLRKDLVEKNLKKEDV